MKVLCIGHATYDIVIPVEEYPKENTKNRIHASLYCGGGPAANAAYLLGKWGVDTFFSGLVGNDSEAKVIEKEFEHVNVNLDYFVKDDNYKTTKSYVIVNKKNASRTSLACQEDNKHLDYMDINIKPDIILIDGHEFELSKRVIKNNPQARVVIDAGRCTDEVVELCHLCDYIVCSKDFAEKYSNSNDLNTMFSKLKNDFKSEIVITLESLGCAYYNNGIKIIKAIPTKAIDTTAAGDIFHGAFVYGLTQNWDMYKILSFANTTSSLSVTRLTGRKSIFPLKIVEDVYNELRKRNIY